MKHSIADFVNKEERLNNLGCRPVHEIKQYEKPFRELNKKKAFVKAVIIIEQAKKRFN